MDPTIKRLFETAVHIAFIPRYISLTTLAEAKKSILEGTGLVSEDTIAKMDEIMVKRLRVTNRIYVEALTQMKGRVEIKDFKALSRRIYKEEGVPLEILESVLPVAPGKSAEDFFLDNSYKELRFKSGLIIALSRAVAQVQKTCSDRITPTNFSTYSREILEKTDCPGIREEQERECVEYSVAVSTFFAATLTDTAFRLEEDGAALSNHVLQKTLERYRALWA